MKTVYAVWSKETKNALYERVTDFDMQAEAIRFCDLGSVDWKQVDDRIVPQSDDFVFIAEEQVPETTDDRIELAVDLIVRYGQIDGSHHKVWVLDQVTRTLLGSKYEEFVRQACDGLDGPDTYSWDEGIAP